MDLCVKVQTADLYSVKPAQALSDGIDITVVRYYFTAGCGANYCDEYVCLSVRPHNSKTTWPNFTQFLCMLSVAVSDGVVMRYVLPVLLMTSYVFT